MKRTLRSWIATGALALVVLPWYQQEAGFFAGRWIGADWATTAGAAPALWLLLQHGLTALWPLFAVLALSGAATFVALPRRAHGLLTLGCGVAGLLDLGNEGAVRVSPQLLDALREDPAVRKVKLTYSPPWANN